MSEQTAIDEPLAPLTPVDCDLTDFAFMPLDVARLRDSELASNETPEACWAAVLLWAASWHQVPAASIPNDEKWIAKAAGYATRGRIDKEWGVVRPGALRGFVPCADGRLYHVVVAEKARESWTSKLRHRWASECARIKKHNDRHETSIAKPTFEEWEAAGRPCGQQLFVPRDKAPGSGDVAGDAASKGQGEGQGQGDSSVPTGTGDADAPPVDKSNPDPERRRLWREGGSMLVEAGLSEGSARALLARLAKEFPAVIREAVAATVAGNPVEPASYLVGACRQLQSQQPGSNTVPGESVADYLARVEGERQAEAAATPSPAETAEFAAKARADALRIRQERLAA